MSEQITPDLASFARDYCAMRSAQTAYFKTRSREDLINSKRLEKALDKAAALVVAKSASHADRATPTDLNRLFIKLVQRMREWQKQTPAAGWAKEQLDAAEAIVDSLLASSHADRAGGTQ